MVKMLVSKAEDRGSNPFAPDVTTGLVIFATNIYICFLGV